MVRGSIVAVVLAAGASSRFGSLKQNHRIDGQTLLGRTVQVLGDAGCRPIVVVTGAQAEALEADWSTPDVSLVHNAGWRDGMGGSISCGVGAALDSSSRVAALLMAVCDQPKLDACVLRRLIERFSTAQEEAVACEYGGQPGVPAIFGESWFDSLRGLRGNEGARQLLRGARPVATIPWPEGACDIDLPSDTARLS